MARQFVISFVLFTLPFILYGIYRLLVMDAEVRGRKTWPLNLLFGSGVVLAFAGYAVMLAIALTTERDRNTCYQPARFENGVLIPAQTVPCEKDLSGVGMPAREDPGGQARGVSGPQEADPDASGDGETDNEPD